MGINKSVIILFDHKTRQSNTFDNIKEDLLTNKTYPAIGFFDSFYGDDKFIIILPYEYLIQDL